jgi:hypothetical protein
VVVIQATDLVRSRRPGHVGPVLCHLYGSEGSHQPGLVPELMAYQAIIAKASRKFKWPSWVVYDQNFRQEAAGNPDTPWSKVEPSLYAQCFTGQETQGEGWCNIPGGRPCLRRLPLPATEAPPRSGQPWAAGISPKGCGLWKRHSH